MSLPISNQLSRALAVVVVLGCLSVLNSSEARGIGGDISQDDLANFQRSIQQAQQQLASGEQQPPMVGDSSSLDRLDSDDDDDEDDRLQLQPGTSANTPAASVQAESSDLHQTASQQASYTPPIGVSDLGTAASKHHGHHHGAKGWLDMGAWTGKKGAFGWYDKHPVGKGK